MHWVLELEMTSKNLYSWYILRRPLNLKKNHNFIWNNICNIKMNLEIFQTFRGLLKIYELEHHWQKIHFFKAKLHKGFTCYMPNPSRKFFMQFYFKDGFQCWKFQGQRCYSKNNGDFQILKIELLTVILRIHTITYKSRLTQ